MESYQNNKDIRPPLIAVSEAAKILNVSIHTIRAWISQRRLPFVKLGRRTLFCGDDLARFINANKVQPKPESKEKL